MTRPSRRLCAAAVLWAAAAGCAVTSPEPRSQASAGIESMEVQAGHRHYAGFMPTTARPRVAREPGCPLDVILDGTPGRPYEVIGMISAERVGASVVEQGGGEEQAIAWLREVACRSGADAMFDVQTASDRSAYVGRAIRGRALVVVYGEGGPAVPAVAPPISVDPAGWRGEPAGTGAGAVPAQPQPGDPEPSSW